MTTKKRVTRRKKTGKRRNHRGGAFFDDVKNFLKKTKLISTVGKVLAPMTPFGLTGIANEAVKYADAQGYGRCNHKGAGVSSIYGRPVF